MNIHLFVYGTLRLGGSNQHFLRNAKLLSTSCWIHGELHDTGFGYPVLKRSQKRLVWGELYEVNKEQLKQIDYLEEYSPLNETNEYVRVVQQVSTETQNLDAYMYLAGDKLLNCENLIESGDWLRYINNNGTNNIE